jgi:hypothetical protein
LKCNGDIIPSLDRVKESKARRAKFKELLMIEDYVLEYLTNNPADSLANMVEFLEQHLQTKL